MSDLSPVTVERWLEKIRQRALVKSGRLIGQIPCGEGHGWYVASSRPCDKCGAAV